MKKALSLLLALVMCLSLCACRLPQSGAEPATTSSTVDPNSKIPDTDNYNETNGDSGQQNHISMEWTTIPVELLRFEEDTEQGGYSCRGFRYPDGDKVQEFVEAHPYLVIPSTYNGEIVHTISRGDWSKWIKGLKIPEGVTCIYMLAFSDELTLQEVWLPDSLTELGEAIFADCTALEKIHLGNNLPYITAQAFENCTALKQISIPATVTSIGRTAFVNCTSLNTIDFSVGLTYIGKEAFSGCTSLSEITLPEGLESIDERAFQSCTNLQTVTIPGSVNKLAHMIFSDCTSLTKVIYGGTISQWESLNTSDLSYNKCSIPEGCVVVCSDGSI